MHKVYEAPPPKFECGKIFFPDNGLRLFCGCRNLAVLLYIHWQLLVPLLHFCISMCAFKRVQFWYTYIHTLYNCIYIYMFIYLFIHYFILSIYLLALSILIYPWRFPWTSTCMAVVWDDLIRPSATQVDQDATTTHLGSARYQETTRVTSSKSFKWRFPEIGLPLNHPCW